MKALGNESRGHKYDAEGAGYCPRIVSEWVIVEAYYYILELGATLVTINKVKVFSF